MCGMGLTDVGTEVASVELSVSGMTVFVLSGSDVGSEVAVGNAAGAAQATKLVPIIKAINSLNSRFVNILISFGQLINADTVSYPYWRGAVPHKILNANQPQLDHSFTLAASQQQTATALASSARCHKYPM